MMQNLVSIIIPAYNTAQYIHRSIESSLRQTHKNVEVLVIDDGSKDDTLSIAESYAAKDSRVHVYHRENAGVSAARNFGITEAKGEYLMFLDSDDWLEDRAVEMMLDAQLKNPGKLVAVNYWAVQLDPARSDIFLRHKNYSVPSRTLTAEETLYASYGSGGTFPPTACAKIFSADIIRKHGLTFREGIHYGEDQLFAFEYLVRTSGSVYLSEPLFCILKRPGSAMTTPFSQQRKNNVDWLPVVVNYPALTDEIRRAARVYAGGAYFRRVREAVFKKRGRDIIRQRKREAQPFIREILSSGKISKVKKVYTLCVMYLPAPIARLVISFWEWLKKRRKNSVDETIPCW